MDATETSQADAASGIPVIDLASAPGERQAWTQPKSKIYLWAIAERLLVTNSWQISSRLRIAVLKLFGAKIGSKVIFRPRTRVSFPWNLEIGANSWIGEGVWIHNQNRVSIAENCVVSQEAFLTTGSHAHRRDMALVTRPIVIEEGVWVTARAVVLGGTTIERSAMLGPNSVAGPNQTIEAGAIYSGNPAVKTAVRF